MIADSAVPEKLGGLQRGIAPSKSPALLFETYEIQPLAAHVVVRYWSHTCGASKNVRAGFNRLRFVLRFARREASFPGYKLIKLCAVLVTG